MSGEDVERGSVGEPNSIWDERSETLSLINQYKGENKILWIGIGVVVSALILWTIVTSLMFYYANKE